MVSSLKYKIEEVPTNLFIIPKFREELCPMWKNIIDRIFRAQLGHEEFAGHQNFHPAVPLKYLDWKKNAGLPLDNWVSKKFQDQISHREILLRIADDSSLDQDKTLEMLRVGQQMLSQLGYQTSVDFKGKIIEGSVEIKKFLASANFDDLVRDEDMGKRPEAKNVIEVRNHEIRQIS